MKTKDTPQQKRSSVSPNRRSSSPLKIFDITPYYDPRLGVTKEEIMEIKKAFDIFDSDGNGSINPKELADAYQEMGMATNSKMIYQLLAELDKDNSGVLDFDEFLKLATRRSEFKPNKQELMKVFRIFDITGKGKISKGDLKKIAEELGEEMSDEELKKMIKKADKDDDGFVTFNDFCLVTYGKTFDDE